MISAPEIEWDPLTPPRYDAASCTATVFAYDDVMRVLHTDGVTMSQQYGPSADREDEHPNRSFMWAWDGKAHDDRRRLLEEPFTKALRGIAPLVRERMVARLEEVRRAGRRFDLMTTLALVPYDVITAMIGAPLEDTVKFLGWLDEANSTSVDAMPRQDAMRDYFLALVARAKREPVGGLLGHLVDAQAAGVTLDGVPIRDRDILANLWGMYSAGTDTTGNSFASLFVMACEDVELWHALRASPEMLVSAVEESLRLDPAFPTIGHETLVPVRFGELDVPAGTKVFGWISSANRDPRVFNDPAVMRLGRKPNPHLTFGNGLHLCLGAPLARIELREMMRVILDRDERWMLRAHERKAGIVHRFTRLEFAPA